MSETLKVIKERRSTRAFEPAQVPLDTIEEILEAGSWAPSGNGVQPWHFTALHSTEKCHQLAKAIAAADNCGPEYNFYGAPSHIIVSCPRESEHAFLDGGAAMQNLLLMAQALGVGSCWINQVRVTCDVPEVRALLTEWGVPEDHIVIAGVALGYTARETPATARREGLITIVS